MRGFVAVSLQFVARCIAYTRCNLQRPGRVLSFFPLKIAYETCRTPRYDHAAKPLSRCRPDQLCCRSLHMLLQSLI
jgi:hypothetical protein